MKNICMYSAQLHCQGGIESVVRDLHRIFKADGARLWCAVEAGRPGWASERDCLCLCRDRNARIQLWNERVAVEKPDVVVFNYVTDECLDLVCADIQHLKLVGVKCAVMMHASFPSAMLLDGCELDNLRTYRLAKECGFVLTVSRIDAKWWTSLGFLAVHVQNPIKRVRKNVELIRVSSEAGRTNLLWVGRISEQKQPKTALAAFAQACAREPNLHLTMVGGGDVGGLRKIVRKYGIGDKVLFLPSRPDISDLWQNADIHLLTSITESFCLVLAEAKSVGIPSIMFDIPFLELVQDKRGLVVLPQGDIGGMADAIVDLARNREVRKRMGEDAFASLDGFNDEVVLDDWRRAVDAMNSGVGFATVSADARIIAAQIFSAWNRYCDKHLCVIEANRDFKKVLGFGFDAFGCVFGGMVKVARAIKRWL